MFFIYLFTANKLYLWDVKRKLNKIMASGNMSEDQLLDTVREKGGTNTLAAVIYVIVIIAYLFPFFSSILANSFYLNP